MLDYFCIRFNETGPTLEGKARSSDGRIASRKSKTGDKPTTKKPKVLDLIDTKDETNSKGNFTDLQV